MNPEIITAATSAVAGAAVFGAPYALAFAKKHKVDLAEAIDKAQTELPLVTQFGNLVEAMLPNPYKTIAVTCTDLIGKSVSFAEQLKDAGMLTADQRKATAMSAITAALSKEGITPDAKTLGAISDAVDIAARVLVPHSTAPASSGTTAAASPAQTPTASVGAAQ